MWKDYFKFVKLKPGRVVTSLFGTIDFSRDDIAIDTIQALYESDFPYLEITEKGKKELYGIAENQSKPKKKKREQTRST